MHLQPELTSLPDGIKQQMKLHGIPSAYELLLTKGYFQMRLPAIEEEKNSRKFIAMLHDYGCEKC